MFVRIARAHPVVNPDAWVPLDDETYYDPDDLDSVVIRREDDGAMFLIREAVMISKPKVAA